ncbi:SLAIN motif-containing protein 1-like [Chaetodon auriga]|uniref:SLAIN motif-containing protein 1-like n=1 Tax=Chaetodon auriga TaxID=39042 RepID=UPI00403300B7
MTNRTGTCFVKTREKACLTIPSPGQLQNRVQSVGNFASLSRQLLKATAYVSPTIKGSASMPTSTSLQSLNCSSGGNSGVGSGIPLLSKAAGGGGTPTSTPTYSYSSLKEDGRKEWKYTLLETEVLSDSLMDCYKIISCLSCQLIFSRSFVVFLSLLTPPKSLSTLSALRDSTWRDGCY